MTSAHKLRIGLLSVFLVLLGCSEERPAINRVQSNAIPKSMFTDSEWYANQTVIDTPAQTALTFVGDSSPLRKIKWEIQENFLIARNVLQHIAGIEDNPTAGEGAEKSGVAAMYRILSHFDIRREYNPSTGEELNIVGENTTDRPWYQRDHFRVDWSQNLVGSEDLALTSSFSGVTLKPVSYFVETPDHPFAPRFEENEDGSIYYIDIVNKYFAEPDSVMLSNGQTVPACYLLFSGNLPCESAEVAVRNSFLRVDPDRDYQPVRYTSDRMERFGYFLTWRDSYDPEYGVTEARRLRFANRHGIWEASHRRDKEGEFVKCGRDDDCGGGGSVCDVDLAYAKGWSQGACTIPYRERKVKPIAYHLSEGFPADLVPDAEAFAEGWSGALRETVGSLRQLECERNGGSDCAGERDRKDADEVFVLCQNPVAESDHEACGAPGTVARIGDLRYSLLAWVSEETQGPLGYGPSFADPETGEIIAASAYVYGAALVRYTAYARDLVALLNDDLEEDSLTSNADFAGWIRAVASGQSFLPKTREAQNHVVAVDGLDAPAINQSMSFGWIDEVMGRPVGDTAAPPVKPTPREAKARIEDLKRRLIDGVSELKIGDLAHARMEALKGTDIERLMVDDELRLAAGFEPGAALTDAVLEKASPLRGMSLTSFRAMDQMKRQIQNKRGTCVLEGDFADEGLLGLIREINRAAKSGDGTIDWYGVPYKIAVDQSNGTRRLDYALIEEMMRHPIYNAVAAHEVGHTLGLRHNFSGSFDSLNYHQRYWELRDDGNMQPRAWDPMTQAELDGRIREYQYSTVMDYGNNFVVSDAAGIGHYDRAAIKMGYGDLVEVFTDVPDDKKQIVASAASLQRFGWPAGLDLVSEGPLRAINYTEMPVLLGGVQNLEKRADVPYRELTEDPQLFEGELVYDAAGRLVVPYRYCGDEFADYEPNCLRYDAGADEYESLTSVADTYWNYYLLNNFMRQRINFNPDSVPANTYSRYFAKLEDANLYYSYFRGILPGMGADPDFFERPDGLGAYTAGIGASYQLLTRVIGTPEPGCYERGTLLSGDPAYVESASRETCATSGGLGVDVDGFDGRALRTGFSYGPDQSFWFLTRSGYFQDKLLALQVLTDPGARVLGQDTNVDIRLFQVSYYTTFQKPVQSILRGIIGQDWRSFAPRYIDSQLVFPDPATQQSGELTGPLMDPNMSFALQLYSMSYGMAYLPRTFDFSFIDRARLFVKGGAEGVDLTLPEGATLIEFLDEESGLTYVAPSYPDENGNETGVSAQALRYAQTLKDAGLRSQLHAWMTNLNVLRRLTYLMGFGGDSNGYL